MVKDTSFNQTVDSLFKGMDSFISTKTVVGEPINVNGVLIVPLADVQFGVGAGAFTSNEKANAGGGMAGKISPSAVLVIQNGNTKLVNIKNQDTIVKILDMIPDLLPEVINKITEMIKGKAGETPVDEKTEASVKQAIDDIAKNEE